MDETGEPFTIVVDGVERMNLWIDKGAPDPILQAGHHADGTGWVRVIDARSRALIGYQTWEEA